MAYLAKSTILKAYEILSSIDDDKRQGLTQKTSALKYGIALCMYFKLYKENCDLKNPANKDIFASLVGRVVKINNGQCTKDFYTSIAPNGRDYDCGSNFYSQSSVKDSRTNTEITLLYPKRSGWQPVMDVSNQVLIYNANYIESCINFYLSSSLQRYAFVIWLLRFEKIETKDFAGLKGALGEFLTDEYCNVLFPDENAEENYFQVEYDDTKCELTETDIKNMFTDTCKVSQRSIIYSHQQIFYGAPGTGKSNTIKKEVDDKGKLNFRTTFHPDSDYSTFVGCYKPTMKRSTITKDGITTTDEKIVYRFEPQAFTNAYVQAWKSKEDVYLIIEEINRGNCAQIFGDLFQLLDRKNGESEYPVDADSSLADYLQTALAESKREDIPSEVKNGTKLKLPKNLYIWATMNTSDQSLFPIDSAFKRRWDWVYVPIDTAKEMWYIKIEDSYYSWTKFLDKVNDELLTDETAEDKHLGFYFCKATEKKDGTESAPNVITAETFVGKVLFYLWNDVFKVYGIPSSIGSSKDWPYRRFYQTDGKVNEDKVTELMSKLKISPEGSNENQVEDQ